MKGHDSTICSVYFSPDNKTLISTSCDYSIKLWNWEKGNVIQEL